MPEEIPDRALANKLLEFHHGQGSALYSVGSCILARQPTSITQETVQQAERDLMQFSLRDQHDADCKEANQLAIKLRQWWHRRKILTPFAIAYIECALWSSSCNETENDDTSLSERYSMADIEDKSIETIISECNDFISQCKPEDLALQRDDQNGHDLWLTRNHHGAGYWDRGLGDAGKRLTDLAHGMGSSDVYVGDDGKLYFT
jgi:hypothetical protein